MSALNTAKAIAEATNVLLPLILQTAEYLQGGAVPEFFTKLPSPLSSQVALDARKARKRVASSQG